MEQEWKQYKRKGLSEMRPYIKGEDLSNISVSATDNPETDMGMIARNPNDESEQHWYVNRKYFEANLEPVGNDNEDNLKMPNKIKGILNKHHKELIEEINEEMRKLIN